MLYAAYQAQADLLAPFQAFADLTSTALRGSCGGPMVNPFFRRVAAGAELFSRAHLTHTRPPFGIDFVHVGDEQVDILEDIALDTPFGALLHFKKAKDFEQPKVILFAPMAGHFPTLLRNTIKTLLPDHDVYLTDWHNARDVPLSAGAFGFEDYVAHSIKFIEFLGPGAHVMAVCQPCAAVLVAISVMAETNNPCQPRSMTLMAGPVDTRISPTKVNELATTNSLQWFEKNLIDVVPVKFAGRYRKVYPGFLQLAAFMSMNLPRHVRAHLDLFTQIVKFEDDKAEATRDFYDEYFAVFDMPAEFYLQTVDRVFQRHLLPRGLMEYQGRKVNPAAIRKTGLLTVEGERDDICAVGQTMAAHDLCSAIKPFRKKHHLQAGVGHYGVFSGTRWQREIYPQVQAFIAANS
ncbi:MAG TPA: polyhydroxyalkanoate depolymerase [Rhizomicrobium sp.]|nr:polyhydroxyalkanoate depolymerase [Rhizomicrobium sp.]